MEKKISTIQENHCYFNKQQTWIKKEKGLFDIMETYDGVAVCELVGSFLLHALSLK